MDTKITAIAASVLEQLNRWAFALDGVVFLGTGTAPTNKYKGFIVEDRHLTYSIDEHLT